MTVPLEIKSVAIGQECKTRGDEGNCKDKAKKQA